MLTLLQTQLTGSNWNWGLGVLSRSRRRSPSPPQSATTSKVRIVPTPLVEEAVKQAQEEITSKYQLELEQFKEKFNDQQTIIDTLKSKLRESESVASIEAVCDIMGRHRNTETIRKACECIEEVRSKCDKVHWELDVSFTSSNVALMLRLLIRNSIDQLK